MIANIIDDRKRHFRFLKINAVVEATWHDNSVEDADQILKASGGPSYEQREHITLASAIRWADSFLAPVTLYLYEEDDGIYPVNV